MKCYLVRLKPEHEPNPREIVGVFVIRRLADLFWAVDECTDPCSCEYTPLGSGGILWLTSGADTVPPADKGDEGDTDLAKGGPTPSEEWMEAFWGDTKWKPVPLSEDVKQANAATKKLLNNHLGWTLP